MVVRCAGVGGGGGGGGVVVTACRCGEGVGIGGVVVSAGRCGEEKERKRKEEEEAQLREAKNARTTAQGSTMHIGRAKEETKKGEGGRRFNTTHPYPQK